MSTKEHRVDFGKMLREAYARALGGTQEDAKVYFQPPEKTKMVYPCIKYQRNNLYYLYADNKPYMNEDRYQVTVISSDPDCPLVREVSMLPYTSYDRQYIGDGLYHDVFEIYY